MPLSDGENQPLSDGCEDQQPPEFGPDPLPPMPWFGMDIGGTLSKVSKTKERMENNINHCSWYILSQQTQAVLWRKIV